MTSPLYTTATSLAALTRAWEDLLADDHDDGTLSTGTRRFATNPHARLTDLADQLTTGTYQPQPLAPVTIPKDNGDTRHLAIPPVTDRIVEKALAATLSPIIDPLLGPAAYAYRPGLGVTDAVQQVARLRAEGLAWAAHADIDDCFPSIDMPRLRRLLSTTLTDADVLTLIDLLLRRPIGGDTGPRPTQGLPQGAPLSPCWPTSPYDTSTTRSPPPDSPWSATATTSASWPPPAPTHRKDSTSWNTPPPRSACA
ncbi:reverse transcriptase domain-containing protein [Micromonospora sp. WMMD734]|uniref:reverse transcriptase domain-containing protein n=1 Tax=Micromonospora sp. WMMD734 TaxID=3404129 RepID=UPI003B965E86